MTLPVAGTDPYPWYAALDLNTIPWHTAAGPWGPQVPIQAPAAPVTTQSVTVHNRADFQTQAAIAGTQITIGTGWDTNTDAFILASDIDIIIPPGIQIGACIVGYYNNPTVYSRIRFRGPTLGQHSGGTMGMYRDWENGSNYGPTTDVIFDGIDLNGGSSNSGPEGLINLRMMGRKYAVVNCRLLSQDACFYGNGKHIVICNTNAHASAQTRAQNVGWPDGGGYGLRIISGPLVMYRTRLQNTRYNTVRVHSYGRTEELFFIKECTLVAMAEGRIARNWNQATGTFYGNGQAAWWENNDIYAFSEFACPNGGKQMATDQVDFAQFTNNRTYGAANSVYNAGDFIPRGGGTAVGNVFGALPADPAEPFPAWGGVGDPRVIPLPNGGTVTSGEDFCTAPSWYE